MAATHAELLDRWFEEAGRENPRFLTRSSNLFVATDGTLYYDRSGRGTWGRGRPARNLHLAKFLGDRHRKDGICLLNGDGFEDNDATAWQTDVRNRAQRQFGMERCPIIPFAAIRGAGIDVDTVKVIQVTEESWDERVHWIPLDFETNNFFQPTHLRTVDGWERNDSFADDPDAAQQVWDGRYNGQRFLLRMRREGAEGRWSVTQASVWAQPENGAPGWQRLTRGKQNYHDIEYRWQWMERIHRLGASIFTAHGPDGRRHRWISAFDVLEPNPLYFLAQLPDRGECKNYEQALDLLAPPIVHAARDAGRHVARQGDVFAIETSATDEEVYKDAVTRVRREVALQEILTPPPVPGRAVAWVKPRSPLPDEIQGEEVQCPFCESPHRWGTGEEAASALMIHGTAHTADEVVVKKGGVTFIRGTLYHDARLDRPGREPDHVDRELQPGIWYLAVRNTVPAMASTDSNRAARRRRRQPFPGAERGHSDETSPYLAEDFPEQYMPPPGFRWAGEMRVPRVGERWLSIIGVVGGPQLPTNMALGLRRHILIPESSDEAEARESLEAATV